MLAGRPPFAEPSVRLVLSSHLKSQPPPLEAADPEVPARVAQIVRRAMEKKPGNRYESAGAMATAIRNVLGEPSRSITPSAQQLAKSQPLRSTPWERLRPQGAGGWLVLSALALGALALLALGLAFFDPG